MVVDTLTFKCWICRTGNGWGPMLTTRLWRSNFPKLALVCESCMVRKIGRPLTSKDLRDCPMNEGHRLYEAHGLM